MIPKRRGADSNVPAWAVSMAATGSRRFSSHEPSLSNRLAGYKHATVGVGIMITHNPLHGSGRAGFPHPALALGEDARAAQGIGMTDDRWRQPASDEAPHTIPKDAPFLAAPRQRAMPEPPHLESEKPQRRFIHGHSVIPDVSTHHRLQPLAQFRNGFVHASLKLGFSRVQLRLKPLADRLPQYRIHSIASLLHADMREAKKVECLRL